jgi:protein-S-isoprenylcysteine O-methyltransferase Ste14
MTSKVESSVRVQQAEPMRKLTPRWVLRVASIVYGLVMFEVVIMLSPFAFYFYSAYGPILKWLDRYGPTSWLTGFVLPHSVVTNSILLEFLRWNIGRYAFSLGLIGFFICAIQIYGAKLLRRKTVAWGAYRYVRHPQYVCLAIAGFGLFTMWPRLIIFLLFVGMLIAYYWLAKIEERHMLTVDPGYADYRGRTAMFLPGNPGGKLYRMVFGRVHSPTMARCLALIALVWALVLVIAGLRSYTLEHVARLTDPSGIEVVSVYPMPSGILREALSLALSGEGVQEALAKEHGATFVSHILPQDYAMMGMFADVGSAHMKAGDISLHSILELGWWLVPFSPQDPRVDLMGSNQNEFRVVFSRVDSPQGMPIRRAEVFSLEGKMTAICIADISLSEQRVIGVVIPPRRSFWGNIKMPIF